ncbi:MAG TPA: DUF5009 domain-containing protein [Sphingobacteriaceae bacterium]
MEAAPAELLTRSGSTETRPRTDRFVSIDAFRALTLLLMLFVNDFGTLRGIPDWLKHTEAAEDGMGFSDVIFPAFLFIVGLSLPVAVDNRMKRSASQGSVTRHILLRSLALLIMGFFHVNLGNFSPDAMLSRPVFQVLSTVGFFLIWMDYPRENRKLQLTGQWAGVALVVAMAAVYRGTSPGGEVWMQPKWWGILGLIGWSYLICALLFLWVSGRMTALVASFFVLMGLNAAAHSGWLDSLSALRSVTTAVGDGSMPAMVMAGAITTQVYRKSGFRTFLFYALAASLALVLCGLATRPYWEISKIRATPPWTMICTGISLTTFAVLVYATDIRGKVRWYEWIRPAGVSTLTCFLLPFIHDAILQTVDYRLPLVLRTGVTGLAKSMAFALLIVAVAGWLQKRRIRLKL